MIVLHEGGNTHNSIHPWVVQETHYYVHTMKTFQILIANGGMMKSGGRCDNMNLQMRDYQLKSHMFSLNGQDVM